MSAPPATQAPTSRPRLVLHIGQTKTGSTSLQRFLALNRARLPELGLHYPTAPQTAAGTTAAKHHHLLVALHPGHLQRGRAHRVWDGLLAQLERQSAQTHVLSDELFWHLGEHHPGHRVQALGFLARQLAGVDVQVLAYLRPQADWLVSWYAQLLRSSGQRVAGMDLPAFEARMRTRGMLDYHRIASDWAEAFGRDRVCLRPWDRAQLHGGDIIDDFLHRLGHNVPASWPRPPALQVAWGPARVALCQTLDQALARSGDDPAQRERFVSWLRGAAVPEHAAPPVMTAALRQRVQAACADSNAALCAEWGLTWPEEPTSAGTGPQPENGLAEERNAWLQLVVGAFIAGGHPMDAVDR